MSTDFNTVLDTALAYRAAGRSVVPIAPGQKAPSLHNCSGEVTLLRWDIYKRQLASETTICSWFPPGKLMGLGIVCGPVSSLQHHGVPTGLEILDFDDAATLENFQEAARWQGLDALLARLVMQQTPGGGAHWGYCCEQWDRNTKLAQRQNGIDAQGKPVLETLIETRGEGGQAVAAPTPPGIHPDNPGLGYTLVQGRWETPPLITPEERQVLLALARSFNTYALPAQTPTPSTLSHTNGARPGDQLNADADATWWRTLLEQHGWTLLLERRGIQYWQRPGKQGKAWSATLGATGPYFYVFSSNASPFDPERAYTPFHAYTLLEHGGNFNTATRALMSQFMLNGVHRHEPNSQGTRPGQRWGASSSAPEPLRRPVRPPTPFPVNALGPILCPMTQSLMATVQAPDALCAQAVLAAATLAVQPYGNVHLDGRVFPLSNFFLTVAESGERKTTADGYALAPHRAWQAGLAQDYVPAMLAYQNATDAWKKSREDALRKHKTKAERERELQLLGPAPAQPLVPIFICEEPSYEGLVKLLQVGRASVGMFASEGGRFIGGHGMSPDNQLKTAAGLSELWDGRPISRVRAGDGSSVLYGRRVSVHLMVQPQVAQQVLGNPLLRDQGLLSRCLVAWPTSTAGTRLYKETDLHHDAAVQAYTDRIDALLHTPLPLEPHSINTLRPRPLVLNVVAKVLWVQFHDHIEGQLGADGDLAPVRGLASKIPEHALRIAGVLSLIEDPSTSTITREAVEAAIILAQFYLEEALRLAMATTASPELALAEKLLDWLKAQGQLLVSLSRVYQFGPEIIRDAKTARQTLDILEEHSWVRKLQGGADVDGTHRKEVWEVYL